MSRIKIGITGGIGSGKSYVSAILRESFGVPVYDCDHEAKRLTASDDGIRSRLTELVGQDVFDGTVLNKKLLADYLFGNPEHASQVNAVIHPAVLRDFGQWAMRHDECQAVALESAILYESGFDGLVDKVLFVDAPEEVRLQRAIRRDGASEQQVRARMQMQQPELNKSRADVIIDNGGGHAAGDGGQDRLLRQLGAALGAFGIQVQTPTTQDRDNAAGRLSACARQSKP